MTPARSYTLPARRDAFAQRLERALHQTARIAMALILIGAVLQIGRLALGLAAMETVLEQAERGW